MQCTIWTCPCNVQCDMCNMDLLMDLLMQCAIRNVDLLMQCTICNVDLVMQFVIFTTDLLVWMYVCCS